MIITISIVGIGAALCRALVEAGMVVCGMSKRKDKMEVRIVYYYQLCLKKIKNT